MKIHELCGLIVVLSNCFVSVVHADTTEPIEIPEYPECGKTDDFQTPRNAGSFQPQKGQFPWMAALGYGPDKTAPEWKCDGILITVRHILTSAFCAKIPELSVARFGSTDLNNDPNYLQIDIVDQLIHKKHDPTKHTNDLAVLKLGEDVQSDANLIITPACLPLTPDLRRKSFSRYNPIVMGWGYKNSLQEEYTTMVSSFMTVFTRNRCIKTFRDFPQVTAINSNMCVGTLWQNNQTCGGNSGGALIAPWSPELDTNYHVYLVIGVQTRPRICDEGKYNRIYTHVGYFSDWIADSIQAL